MKNYKVLKGKVGGYGNRYFEVGSSVKENDFPPGIANTLVKMGFLEEITEAPEVFIPREEIQTWNGKSEQEMSKKEITSELMNLEVKFKPTESKSELFTLLVKNKDS